MPLNKKKKNPNQTKIIFMIKQTAFGFMMIRPELNMKVNLNMSTA